MGRGPGGRAVGLGVGHGQERERGGGDTGSEIGSMWACLFCGSAQKEKEKETDRERE